MPLGFFPKYLAWYLSNGPVGFTSGAGPMNAITEYEERKT